MRLYLIILLTGFCTGIHAQINYTGHYGDKESLKELQTRTPGRKIAKDETGYESDLIIVNLKGNQYKFFLFISKGYPAYHTGELEGIINIVKDTAVFYETDTVIGTACRLVFRFSKTKVSIEQKLEDNCGFGANVWADGDYPKIKSRPAMSDIIDILHYSDIKARAITEDKAVIYDEPDASKISKKYFIKGDKVYFSMIDIESDFIFVRYMSTTGRYTEGWVKTSTIN
jgi:hypothetical protein